MSKERYNQIIDEAFKNYYDKSHEFKGNWPDTKEEFVDRCITDKEFSERWGLKIEERELSLEERLSFSSWLDPFEQDTMMVYDDIETCDDCGFPTKLITVTYQNEKIEVYE